MEDQKQKQKENMMNELFKMQRLCGNFPALDPQLLQDAIRLTNQKNSAKAREEICKKFDKHTAQIKELKEKYKDLLARDYPAGAGSTGAKEVSGATRTQARVSEEAGAKTKTIAPRSSLSTTPRSTTPTMNQDRLRPRTSLGGSTISRSSAAAKPSRRRHSLQVSGLPSCMPRASKEKGEYMVAEDSPMLPGDLLQERTSGVSSSSSSSSSRRRSDIPQMGKQVAEHRRQRRRQTFGSPHPSVLATPERHLPYDASNRGVRVTPRMGYERVARPSAPTPLQNHYNPLQTTPNYDVFSDQPKRQEESRGIVSSIAKRLAPKQSGSSKKRRSDQFKARRSTVLSDIKLRNKDGELLSEEEKTEISFDTVIQIQDRSLGDGEESADSHFRVPQIPPPRTYNNIPTSPILDPVNKVADMTVDVSKISCAMETSIRDQASILFSHHEEMRADVLHSTLQYPLHSTMLQENPSVDISSISELTTGCDTINESSEMSFDVDQTLQQDNQDNTLGNCSVCKVLKMKRQVGQRELFSPRPAVGLNESDFLFDHTNADFSLNATRGTVADMHDFTVNTQVLQSHNCTCKTNPVAKPKPVSFNKSSSSSKSSSRRAMKSKSRKSYAGPKASPLYDIDEGKENQIPTMLSQNSSLSSTLTSEDKKGIKRKMREFNNSLLDASGNNNITMLGFM